MIRIVGDGVAGLCCALELRRRGHVCEVVGRGSRHPPGTTALVHPFAGRSFDPPSLELEAWRAAEPFLEDLVGRGVAQRCGMVRPLVGETGRRLLRSYEQNREELEHEFGVSWSQWQGEAALAYESAFAVDIGTALAALREEVEVSPARSAPCDARILAVGSSLNDWVQGDDVRTFGGHLGVARVELDAAVSGVGCHVTPTLDGRVCVGSTWWEEDPGDDVAVRELEERLGRLGLEGEVEQTWSGRRCVYQPDRRPVVGRLGERTVLAGALGTRGWLWAPLVAAEVAAVIEGRAARAEVSVVRTSLTLRREE